MTERLSFVEVAMPAAGLTTFSFTISRRAKVQAISMTANNASADPQQVHLSFVQAGVPTATLGSAPLGTGFAVNIFGAILLTYGAWEKAVDPATGAVIYTNQAVGMCLPNIWLEPGVILTVGSPIGNITFTNAALWIEYENNE